MYSAEFSGNDATFIDEVSFGISHSLLMQRVQQDLAAAGIQIRLNPVSDPIMEEMNAEGSADISLWSWGPDYAGIVPYVTSMGLYEGTWVGDMAGIERAEEAQGAQTPELLAKALAADSSAFDGLKRGIAEETRAQNVIIPLINPSVVRASNQRIESFNCQFIYSCQFSAIELADG